MEKDGRGSRTLIQSLLRSSGNPRACMLTEPMWGIPYNLYAAIDPADRARILAVSNTVVLAIASPFGWIAGALAEVNHVLPFVLIGILVLSVSTFLVVVQPKEDSPTVPR